MMHHELLVSDELIQFLDEEASSMAVDVRTLTPLSIHDILLLDEPIYKCIVRKKEEVTIQVRGYVNT